jgi:hypothetical protein
MRKLGTWTACVLVLACWACGNATISSTANGGSSAAVSSGSDSKGKITGFAFVNSSVTSLGSQAKLPEGTKIYPSGSKITGTEGCPSNRYHTDGLLIVVLDYTGRPTAGSVAVTRHPASGGAFNDAPYYIDLNAGRTLQTLGPIFDNGSYDVVFSYNYNQGQEQKDSATITLSRSCPY